MPLVDWALMVEDDPGHAQIMQDYFALAESFQVEWVNLSVKCVMGPCTNGVHLVRAAWKAIR